MINKCDELHKAFTRLKRHTFPFLEKEIPKNGIYILFQEGEYAHGVDRIVRIGTHTGENQLRSRLKQHFLNENKDRSIFRKNIGRALLNRKQDSYIKIWELDLTTKAHKDEYSALIDNKYQTMIEKEVSKVIQSTFSFVVLEVQDKDDRLFIESRLISEISNCMKCNASISWLGNYSTKDRIRESGLWQVNELYKDGFSDDEFSLLVQRFGCSIKN